MKKIDELYLRQKRKVWGEAGLVKSLNYQGLKELNEDLINVPLKSKNRKESGGRKTEMQKNESLVKDIEDIVSPYTMGDPMKPLQWTSKSLRKIDEVLKEKNHKIS